MDFAIKFTVVLPDNLSGRPLITTNIENNYEKRFDNAIGDVVDITYGGSETF